ncbi:MAG: hypothetical protein RLZZ516_2409, partial [Cyanobacteriota bacterium]
PAVLPSSSGASAEAPESILGTVRLVGVVLENQGNGPAHPLQRLAFQECTLSPGYAGAEASGNFHHLVGLGRKPHL